MPSKLNVAVCGATGAVGQQMLACLEERNFPYTDLKLLASPRSQGRELTVKGSGIKVEALGEDSFKGIDLALFSAGAGVSREWAPKASAAGTVVVDNSSAWRMDEQVPLVVPEVNPEDIAMYKNKGIIANPNCSTIQMVVALKPLSSLAAIKRVVVATYQAVSGTGQKAIDELAGQARAHYQGQALKAQVYPYPIFHNLLPHIDVFEDNGYSREEMKMVNETRKIMHQPDIMISATCVRVPVVYGHSEALNVTFAGPVSPEAARQILSAAPGVKVVDDPAARQYPMPVLAAGQDLTLVGRIRKDLSQENGLDLWVVADNIRKGAATNAVQIAEMWLASR
ncbi:MAG: aspartate-semialdehyde dehydrogenase [Desulfarculales bacterium]|jgi:aspartate-semialdehyde dehydrogenase|nr:aspartate-semialdehyde dehydrogenase [Desulfarculales bacterium]